MNPASRPYEGRCPSTGSPLKIPGVMVGAQLGIEPTRHAQFASLVILSAVPLSTKTLCVQAACPRTPGSLYQSPRRSIRESIFLRVIPLHGRGVLYLLGCSPQVLSPPKLRGPGSNRRPTGHEPVELPLLHPASAPGRT